MTDDQDNDSTQQETLGSERRRSRRYSVEGVSGSFNMIAEARVLNLSLDGMAIETHVPTAVGEEYSLRLDQGETTMELSGTVAWCRLVRTEKDDEGSVSPVYEAGLKLDGDFSPSSASLLSFIHKNATVDLERRIFGRFGMNHEEAQLSRQHRFLLKRISHSGLLFEADVAPPIGSEVEVDLPLIPGMSVEAKARVAYVNETSEDRPVEVGAEFLSLREVDRLVLETFIKDKLT